MAAPARSPVGRAATARLAAAVLRAEGAAHAVLSITYVGPARMRTLNREHLGHDHATDVIAFAYRPSGAGRSRSRAHAMRPAPPLVGDIYICPRVAGQNARIHGGSEQAEVRRLVIHGVLHTLGYDHAAGPARSQGVMWRTQERYLTRFGRAAS